MAPPSALAVVPGTTVTCGLLTALVVLQAFTPPEAAVGQWLICLYLASLYACFATIRCRNPGLRPLPFRLLEWGFLVLTWGFGVTAILRSAPTLLPPDAIESVQGLLQGPNLVLGVSLISYGIILLIGEQLQRHAELADVYAQTRADLQDTAAAHQTAQRRLREADALTAIGELAAGVAHDLRNPLTVVRAAVDDLADRARNTDDQAEHFDVIRRNLSRVENTIQGLLDAGRVQPARDASTPLARLLEEVLEMVRREALGRGVALRVDGPRDARIAADSEALGRALTNLIVNAVQASVRGGVVRIKTRLRESARGAASRRSCHGELAIAIDDRGRGMDARVRERLFRPFFTTKPDGTGLGLLSAQRLIASQGGEVRLYPRHRGGTRAVVTLPLIESRLQAPIGAPSQPAAATQRVGVVADATTRRGRRRWHRPGLPGPLGPRSGRDHDKGASL